MKSLLFGIVVIVVVALGGFLYRNVLQMRSNPIACPLDAQLCPDGTSVAREGVSCTFRVCPPPNVSLTPYELSFALPPGLERAETETGSVATYALAGTSTSPINRVVVRVYPLEASTTALEMIQKSAISDPSGLPVNASSFTSTVLGGHRFTVVNIGRFEGQITTAYYLARAHDLVRFDAIDSGVMNWTDTTLKVDTLPAHGALRDLLKTLVGE